MLLRPSGNRSANFVIVLFRLVLYKGYKFYVFAPEIFSSSIFTSTSNGVPYLALINRFGGLKMRCGWDIRDSLLWAICKDMKFGKVFLLENLCDVCLWKHRCVKIGIGLPNCSWGQVLTGAWILLSCVLGLHWTKDTDFIFFLPQIFSSSIFASTSNGVSYLALINRFVGLKMRCSWDIRDSLLWAIC